MAQNEESAFDGVRNIFVTSTPAQNFTQSATGLRWITSFEDSQPAGASNPYLVKLGEDRLLLLWEAQEELQFGFLDGSGKLVGNIYHGSGRLSDCQPVILEGSVWWYCTAKSGPVFYRLDPKTGGLECLNGSVSVTLDPNGGTVSPSMVSVTYGASYGPLPDPVRLDYAFAGWYLDQGGTKLRVTEDTQVTIGRDHTLYAQWTPAPHTHDYKADVTPPSCTEGATPPTPVPSAAIPIGIPTPRPWATAWDRQSASKNPPAQIQDCRSAPVSAAATVSRRP